MPRAENSQTIFHDRDKQQGRPPITQREATVMMNVAVLDKERGGGW